MRAREEAREEKGTAASAAMKYLLDTSVWLWSLTASDRINSKGRELLASGGGEVYLSAASSWEIGIKAALGKLPLPGPTTSWVPKRMSAQGVRPLSITHSHALAVSNLPFHHSDPFDSLLIAPNRDKGGTRL